MNSPALLVGKITQKINYNFGRVFKEAGLGNSILKPLLWASDINPDYSYSHGQIRKQTLERHWLHARVV